MNPGKFISLLLATFCLHYPVTCLAQWKVNSNIENEAGTQVTVAHTSNADGYTLEIYKDSVSAIRSRFSLNNGLIKFKEHSCPTYQIDQNAPGNLSVDGAACVTNGKWVEYILGHVENDHVTSPTLLSVMNGFTMTFRFQLENGDFRETHISLSGSKRSMTAVIGEKIIVRAR